MAIFKAVYAAVLVAFDRSVFNGGEHKCLDKTDIIIGDRDTVRVSTETVTVYRRSQ